MNSENNHYSDKGSHLKRAEYDRATRNLRAIPSFMIDELSVNIPLSTTIRRSMKRTHPSGKR